MKKRSVRIAGHPTSISLEDEFWDVLRAICAEQNRSLGSLVTEIDAKRSGNLSSALRLYVLASLQEKLKN
jgi:predicted DNA-binding ribbon-helix-helix protein